jgi:hypothetical protein
MNQNGDKIKVPASLLDGLRNAVSSLTLSLAEKNIGDFEKEKEIRMLRKEVIRLKKKKKEEEEEESEGEEEDEEEDQGKNLKGGKKKKDEEDEDDNNNKPKEGQNEIASKGKENKLKKEKNKNSSDNDENEDHSLPLLLIHYKKMNSQLKEDIKLHEKNEDELSSHLAQIMQEKEYLKRRNKGIEIMNKKFKEGFLFLNEKKEDEDEEGKSEWESAIEKEIRRNNDRRRDFAIGGKGKQIKKSYVGDKELFLKNDNVDLIPVIVRLIEEINMLYLLYMYQAEKGRSGQGKEQLERGSSNTKMGGEKRRGRSDSRGKENDDISVSSVAFVNSLFNTFKEAVFSLLKGGVSYYSSDQQNRRSSTPKANVSSNTLLDDINHKNDLLRILFSKFQDNKLKLQTAGLEVAALKDLVLMYEEEIRKKHEDGLLEVISLLFFCLCYCCSLLL